MDNHARNKGEKKMANSSNKSNVSKSPFTYFPARYMGSINVVNPFFFFFFFFQMNILKGPKLEKIELVKN